jgi:electron transport complex protein RnfE
MNKNTKVLFNGLIEQNPVFVLLLGMCPTLATSTTMSNAIGMGMAATAVLICSNLFISLLRKKIPEKIRIAGFIIIIAGFVTVVEMLIDAYFPSLQNSLGAFIPLIVVNCIILARAESFASKNPPFASVLDGLGMGLGFTVALSLMAFVRELLSGGSLFGIHLIPDSIPRIVIFSLPPGGFLTLGFLIALFQYIKRKRTKVDNRGTEG